MNSASSKPALNGIPAYLPQWPVFGAEEQDAVRVLASGGSTTDRRRREFRRRVTLLAPGTLWLSPTAPLRLNSLCSLGIGPGDEVTTPRTFIASASATARGAQPVFADVDPDRQPYGRTVRARISDRTRAIIVAGCQRTWIRSWNSPTNTDSSSSRTALRRTAPPTGAGRRFHRPCQLFCQDKIMTTGGEGMVTLSDTAAWTRVGLPRPRQGLRHGSYAAGRLATATRHTRSAATGVCRIAVCDRTGTRDGCRSMAFVTA